MLIYFIFQDRNEEFQARTRRLIEKEAILMKIKDTMKRVLQNKLEENIKEYNKVIKFKIIL